MNNNSLALAIAAAIAANRIPHPVFLDGQMLTAESARVSENFEQGGWIFDLKSPIGAPMSRGVEALRAELIRAGNRQMADKLPRYHIIRWWRAPVTVSGFAVLDPARFKRPEDTSGYPLTQLQWDSICDNLWAHNNHLYGSGQVEGGAAYSAILRNQYRGEMGRDGFLSRAIADSKRTGGLTAAINIWQPNPYAAYVYERVYQLDTEGTPVPEYYSVVPVQPLPDHCIYDVWWDGRTDEAVTRYYRNWAVSYGARIPAEPVS